MGRASNRKKARRELAAKGLSNPVIRKAIAVTSKSKVVEELNKATTDEQIEVLSGISQSKVGKALMKKAPKEMDKGIKELQKQGREVTVKELCKEIRETPAFLKMSEDAGVPYKWYEELAKQRMEAKSI